MISDGSIDIKPILLIALGGNALIRKGQEGTIEEQFGNLRVPIRQIAALAENYKIVITHGNGPQVGNIMLQQESCKKVPKLPLEILVAQTQGQIGYMIESAIDEALMEIGINDRLLVSLITYVVVDKDDPGFKKPSKPIGPAFTEKEASGLPYPTLRTSKGYRRVVASPNPLTIVEKREIQNLIQMDFIVICCGGGGIPVVREGRAFSGVDAVIDKDIASALLAEEISADIFMIATDVPGAMLNFGTTGQKLIRRLTQESARLYSQQGEFGAGSMLPKVKATVSFVSQTGKRAVITSIEHIKDSIEKTAGTEVVQ
ncbi:MAG: carbamate kinase [Desulfobacterales bacterium]